MNRALVLAAAVAMQLCLGGIYAWSAFVPELRETYGYSATQTQLVFGTAFLVFTVTGVFAGRGQDRWGPRPFGIASGVFLAAGYLLAGASEGSYLLLWTGIGVLGGLGIGCGYVCTIATAVKWFPRHRGLVSGVAVAGYGAGAIVLANLAEQLFARGWSALEVLRTVGWTYGPIVILAGALLTVPPSAEPVVATRFLARRLLGDRRFWALAVAMFCGTLPGLLLTGSLKPIGLSFGASASTATLAITFFAIGSGTGRIAWGFAGDRFGSRPMALLSLAVIALSPLLFLATDLAGPSAPGFLVAALVAGFGYGSSFALYPMQVAEGWGAARVGTIYGLVMVAHGLAAEVGPGIGGLAFDRFDSFVPALLFAAALAAVGGLVYRALSRSAEA